MAAGPFTAATASRSPHPPIRSSTAAGQARQRQSIPPRPASRVNARLRSATTRAPSSSEKIPATHAAAISPWECPATASGCTPAACQTAASDTIIAHSTGCMTSMDPVQARGPVPASKPSTSAKVPVQVPGQRLPAFGQPGREHRRRGGQFPAHAGPLSTLPGEHEHHPADISSRDRAGQHARCCLPGGQCGQSGRQFVLVPAGHHRPVLEHGPGGGQRPAHVGRVQVRPGRDELG